MRLWHYELIPYLPKSQLIAQWRELNSIFKKEDKHILINYIYSHDKECLRTYAWAVIDEMNARGYKINSMVNMARYFGEKTFLECDETMVYPEHNDRYLRQCFCNLQEKYDRGQKDFTREVYSDLLNGYIAALRK